MAYKGLQGALLSCLQSSRAKREKATVERDEDNGRNESMKDEFAFAEDIDRDELLKRIAKKFALMTPAEFEAFKDFVRVKQPELYERLFVEADYSEIDTCDHFEQ